MSLINLLGFKKKEKEQVFLDEDLTAEEINQKILDLDWDEASNYVSRLSPQKKSESLRYTLKEWTNYMKKEDEKCFKEHGRSAWDYYDLEHPCDD